MSSDSLNIRFGASLLARMRSEIPDGKMSQFVREAVIEKLDQTSSGEVHAEVLRLRADIDELRNELAEGTRAILIVTGDNKPLPKAEAENWVKENMRLRRPVGSVEARFDG